MGLQRLAGGGSSRLTQIISLAPGKPLSHLVSEYGEVNTPRTHNDWTHKFIIHYGIEVHEALASDMRLQLKLMSGAIGEQIVCYDSYQQYFAIEEVWDENTF